MSPRIDRRSFLKGTVGVAAIGVAGFRPRRSEAQDKRTLVVAWDTDIDTLDPAHFKAIGGYVTVANCYDTLIGWKVRPIKRSEEHTSELQSHSDLVCRLLLEKKTGPPEFRRKCPDNTFIT